MATKQREKQKELTWDKTSYVITCGAEERNGDRKPKVWRLGADLRVAHMKLCFIQAGWSGQKRAAQSAGIKLPVWTEPYLKQANRFIEIGLQKVSDAAHVQNWLNEFGNDPNAQLPAQPEAEVTKPVNTLQKFITEYDAKLDDDVRRNDRTGGNASRHKSSLKCFVRFVADEPYNPANDNRLPSEGKQREYFDHMFAEPSAIKDRDILEIGYKQVSAFVSNISNRSVSGYKPDTIKTTVDQVRQFFDHLEVAGTYHAPFNYAKVLTVEKSRLMTLAESKKLNSGQDTFTVEELTTLYGKANDQQRLYMLLGLNLCCTQQTLCDLLPDDIDLTAGVIEFVRGKTRHVNAGRGVTGRYDLWSETLTLLKERIADQPRPAKASYADHALLTADGFPLLRNDAGTDGTDKCDSVRLAWDDLLEKVGAMRPDAIAAAKAEALKSKQPWEAPAVRWLSFKYLRKTMATWIEAMTDEATAKQGLAQSRTGVTARHYLGQKKFTTLADAMQHIHDQKLKPMFKAGAKPAKAA